MNEEKKSAPKKIFGGQYGIVIICDGEKHQQKMYARLRKILGGVKIKVVCV